MIQLWHLSKLLHRWIFAPKSPDFDRNAISRIFDYMFPIFFYVIFVSHLRVDFSAQKIINTSSALFLSHCFLIENDKRRMRREREERCNRRKFNIRSVEERLTFCSNEKITMTKGKTGITHNKTTVTTHITGSAEPKFSFFKNTDMQLLKKSVAKKICMQMNVEL